MNNLYIDTNIWIYFLEKDRLFGALSRDLIIDFVLQNKFRVIASTILYSEVLVIPKNKEKLLRKSYLVLLENSKAEYYSVDKEIAILASKIRTDYKLTTPDAIHISTALINNVNFFITEDKKLLNIKSVEIEQKKLKIIDLKNFANKYMK